MQETFELLELIRNNDEDIFTSHTTSKYDQVMIFLSARHLLPTIGILQGMALSISYFTIAFHHLNFPGKLLLFLKGRVLRSKIHETINCRRTPGTT